MWTLYTPALHIKQKQKNRYKNYYVLERMYCKSLLYERNERKTYEMNEI